MRSAAVAAPEVSSPAVVSEVEVVDMEEQPGMAQLTSMALAGHAGCPSVLDTQTVLSCVTLTMKAAAKAALLLEAYLAAATLDKPPSIAAQSA